MASFLLRSSRILRGVRLFLFLISGMASGHAAAPTTTEGRVNRNAFPLARYADRYAPLPAAIEPALRARIEQALAPVRLAPRSWFRASFGITPSPGDRRKIIASLSDTEIWKCLGESCRGCTGDESAGCALGAQVSGGTGVVLLVHPCLYGEGTCPRGVDGDVNAWVERVIAASSFYKSGLERKGNNLKKSQQASSEWIRETSKSVNQILGACPGPYSSESMAFLRKLDSVSIPNWALRKCGEAYVSSLETLPQKCPALRKSLKAEWKSIGGGENMNSDVLRIDEFGMRLLCRKKSTKTVWTLFASRRILLLGDGACTGQTPVAINEFLNDSIPSSLRKKLDEYGCTNLFKQGIDSGRAAEKNHDASKIKLIE